MAENAKIDQNFKGVLLGTSDNDATPKRILAGDTTGRLLVDATTVTTPPSSMGNGSKNVSSSGNAVALASATVIAKVIIRAKSGNAGKIFVGGSTVSSTSGIYLLPTESQEIEIDDLAEVYIDAENGGDGVVFTYTIA